MSPDEFRSVALSLPEAVEAAHMNHPDFRVKGKIFATLGPNEDWGARGCTKVCLEAATVESVRRALIAAWRNTAPKRLAHQLEESP